MEPQLNVRKTTARRWWRGLPPLTKSSMIAGSVVVLGVLVLLWVVSVQESFRFAVGVLIGQEDPFDADTSWTAVTFALLNVFLVPVLFGGAVGAALALRVRQRPQRGPVHIEEAVQRRDERFGRYDRPQEQEGHEANDEEGPCGTG